MTRNSLDILSVVMKEHQSHDVLLLCPACHELSNCQDLQLRKKLADLCDAPLSGPISHMRDDIPRGWKMLQSAVNVLREGTAIPHERRKELEAYIMKFTGYRELTPVLLNLLHEQLLVKSPQKSNLLRDRTKKSTTGPPKKPHGLMVCTDTFYSLLLFCQSWILK